MDEVAMYEVVKLISLLVYPLGFAFVLAGLALLMHCCGRGRWCAALGALAFVWLWAWSMPVTSDALLATLERRYEHLPLEAVPLADAVVVLGGAFEGVANWPYPSAREAVDRYWHAARAPLPRLRRGRCCYGRGSATLP